MKKYITIGLGNFGLSLAKQLEENGCEVLGIDMERDIVEQAKDYLSHCVIADASNRDVLQGLKIKRFDGAIISIGQDMAPSVLISLYLIELGLKNVIVRALSEDHGKILNKIGVTEIIYPETEIAIKLANRLSMKNAVDYLPLIDEHGILEINAPKSFIKKDLKELNISGKYHCQVIAIKYSSSIGRREADSVYEIKIPPAAEDIVEENCLLVLIGKLSDIEKIQKL